jgi:hypothetical protein
MSGYHLDPLIGQRENHSPTRFFQIGLTMSRVSINTPAPDFTLPDFAGEPFRLSDLREKFNTLLVFNRTFT